MAFGDELGLLVVEGVVLPDGAAPAAEVSADSRAVAAEAPESAEADGVSEVDAALAPGLLAWEWSKAKEADTHTSVTPTAIALVLELAAMCAPFRKKSNIALLSAFNASWLCTTDTSEVGQV